MGFEAQPAKAGIPSFKTYRLRSRLLAELASSSYILKRQPRCRIFRPFSQQWLSMHVSRPRSSFGWNNADASHFLDPHWHSHSGWWVPTLLERLLQAALLGSAYLAVCINPRYYRIRIQEHTSCSRGTLSYPTQPSIHAEYFTYKPMTNIIVKSEPGFSPSVDAEIVGSANDYIHNDSSGKHMRLNAHGVVK